MNPRQTPTEPRRHASYGGVVVPCPGPVEYPVVIGEAGG